MVPTYLITSVNEFVGRVPTSTTRDARGETWCTDRVVAWLDVPMPCGASDLCCGRVRTADRLRLDCVGGRGWHKHNWQQPSHRVRVPVRVRHAICRAGAGAARSYNERARNARGGGVAGEKNTPSSRAAQSFGPSWRRAPRPGLRWWTIMSFSKNGGQHLST